MLERVPKPGFSRSGIQARRTKIEMIKVENPSDHPVLSDTPSAKTVHGALPIFDCTSRESPNPKMARPKKRTAVRRGFNCQR
jgi:hypothetical protein